MGTDAASGKGADAPRVVPALAHILGSLAEMLLYFSGHGDLDRESTLHLIAPNTQQARLRSTALEAPFIRGEMETSRCQQKVLILDCCYSGSFAKGAKGATLLVDGERMFKGIGGVALTASDRTKPAFEGHPALGGAGNSVFTHYLLEGLRTGKAGKDEDEDITIDELYKYVHARVTSDPQARQTPRHWAYDRAGEIIIARNPSTATPIPLSNHLQEMVTSPNSNLRLDAIKQLAGMLSGNSRRNSLAACEALQWLVDDENSSKHVIAARGILDQHPPSLPTSTEAVPAPAPSDVTPQDEAARLNASGKAFLKQKKHAEAASREAARLDPDNADYHNNLGNALNNQNQYAEAAFREAVCLKPKETSYRQILVDILMAQGKVAESMKEAFNKWLS